MSRYIDADALCKLARNHVDGTVDCNDIMRFPTVDAVQVVRCRECEHMKKKRFVYADGRIEYYKRCEIDNRERPNEYFCADGERKEGTE